MRLRIPQHYSSTLYCKMWFPAGFTLQPAPDICVGYRVVLTDLKSVEFIDEPPWEISGDYCIFEVLNVLVHAGATSKSIHFRLRPTGSMRFRDDSNPGKHCITFTASPYHILVAAKEDSDEN